MDLHKKTICRLVVAIIVLLLPGAALAGTFTQTFRNGFETDAIYLFLYDDEPNPKVLFEQVAFNSASWSIADQSNPNTYLKLTGDAAFDPGNLRMTITFSDGPSANFTTPFSLEWAEYLNGAPSASDAMGTITRQDNRWIASNDFNSTVPTPLPASTWLLLSGLFFLVGVRRHARA